MALSDKALGGLMLLTAGFVFVYYTIWALLLPFFDASSPIHDLFPPREWAVRLPAFILAAGLSVVGSFIGVTIYHEKKRQAEKARLRAA